MGDIKTEWFCIINPHAGSGKTMPEWRRAEAFLSAADVCHKDAFTNAPLHAVTLAHNAASEGYRSFLVVGGDGSVHEVLNGIMRFVEESGVPAEGFKLAVIPIGSGNDWIKSTGVPHDTETIVSLISKGSFSPQDVVKAESPEGVCYMANVGGLGFDSHVCMRVNHQKEQGYRSRFIYLVALIRTIFSLKKQRLSVFTDGRKVFDDYAYSIAFGNGRYSGGGMRQVPLSRLDDGLLDYMIVPCLSVLKIARELPKLFNGRLYQADGILMGTCRSVTVNGDDVFEIDGEIRGSLPLTITMTGQQIQVLTGLPGLNN